MGPLNFIVKTIVYMAIGAMLAVGLGLVSAEAFGQTMCGEHEQIVASLEKTYSETPVSMGLASNGTVIEVLASSSGSFTIIVTRPSGLSCLMAAGESWEDLPDRPMSKGPAT